VSMTCRHLPRIFPPLKSYGLVTMSGFASGFPMMILISQLIWRKSNGSRTTGLKLNSCPCLPKFRLASANLKCPKTRHRVRTIPPNKS